MPFPSDLSPPEVPTIGYFANQFPSPVEPYVFEEIEELRQRGLQVIPGSARGLDEAVQELQLKSFASETLTCSPSASDCSSAHSGSACAVALCWRIYWRVSWCKGASRRHGACMRYCIRCWALATR
jgi:hypothetical protein